MPVEVIINTLYSPLVATVIASCALLISLYVLYRQIASLPKKRKHKVFISKPAFSFDLGAINKDFITLAFIILVVAGIFSLYALFTTFEIKKYVQIGALFVTESVLKEENIEQVAAVAVEPFEYALEVEEEEIVGTSTENVQIIEPAKEVAHAEILTAKAVAPIAPSVSKPTPPPAVVPLPKVIPPEALKVAEEISPTKVEKPEAAGDAPDITLRALSYYGSELVDGGIISFSVIVKNEGKQDMDLPFNTQFFIDNGNDGKINLYLSRLETRPLKIGDEETKIWRGAWSAKVGTHRAEICADIDNAILEMNEKNNCADIVLTVTGNEVTGDLIVENVVINPLLPAVDDYVSFSAYVKNIGDKKSPSSYAYIRLDNGLLGKVKIGGIESGMRENVTSAWKATSGIHPYEICADGKKEVFETNEENNCSNGIIEVKNITPS
ncbi:MAG: CARDB domain-containing protein [bacterium]|nr:CARDB domain-containing protein [bacterium]